MDKLIKQRLVGALILVALGVVFWPIIFMPLAPDVGVNGANGVNGVNGGEGGIAVRVPEAPPVNLEPLPEPDNAGLRRGSAAIAQAEVAPDVLMPDASLDDAPPPAMPARDEVLPEPTLELARETLKSPEMDADGLPIAFSLQVATMADKERAEVLRDDLVTAGYKAYVKRLRRDERALYRVLVGPKYSRDDLLAIQAAVDKTWRVESMIIRYLP